MSILTKICGEEIISIIEKHGKQAFIKPSQVFSLETIEKDVIDRMM